jgi:hypothetical protein
LNALILFFHAQLPLLPLDMYKKIQCLARIVSDRPWRKLDTGLKNGGCESGDGLNGLVGMNSGSK